MQRAEIKHPWAFNVIFNEDYELQDSNSDYASCRNQFWLSL